ncbi:hypothetical protein BJX96DRAFT_140878 [Aspergillus floccosus]
MAVACPEYSYPQSLEFSIDTAVDFIVLFLPSLLSGGPLATVLSLFCTFSAHLEAVSEGWCVAGSRQGSCA